MQAHGDPGKDDRDGHVYRNWPHPPPPGDLGHPGQACHRSQGPQVQEHLGQEGLDLRDCRPWSLCQVRL